MSSLFLIAQPAATVVDPHLTTDRRANLGIRYAQFETLIRRDRSAGYVPALSSMWQVQSDARVWIFTLRDDVRFHDGELLSAASVVESINRLLTSGIAGELGTSGVIQGYLSGSTVDMVDAVTVRITTPQPMSDLLDLLVDLPIVSSSLNGSGPYLVDNCRPETVEMRANLSWWRGTPSHERLHWLAIPDVDARVDALLAGEVDLISDVPRGAVHPLNRHTGPSISEQWSPTCIAFLCRCFDGPCQDVRVRQALNLGLDKKVLIQGAAGDDAQVLNGPLTPLHFAYDPETPPFPYEPEMAKTLLSEAGFGGGLEITLDVPTSLPEEAPELARLMALQWERIGVMATIRVHEDREKYANSVRNKQIGDAACFDSSPLSSFRVLREKLHSGIAGPWWQGYHNPDVNTLLDRATEAVDEPVRRSLYRRAYRLIRDDAPWIFLYQPAYRWASRDVASWSPTPVGWIDAS